MPVICNNFLLSINEITTVWLKFFNFISYPLKIQKINDDNKIIATTILPDQYATGLTLATIIVEPLSTNSYNVPGPILGTE